MLLHQRQRQQQQQLRTGNIISIHTKAIQIFFITCSITLSISARSLYLGYTKPCEYSFQPSVSHVLIGFGLIGSICSIIAFISIVIASIKVDDSGNHLWYVLYAVGAGIIYGISAIIMSIFNTFIFYKEWFGYQSNVSEFYGHCHASIYNFCYSSATIFLGLSILFPIWLIRRFLV